MTNRNVYQKDPSTRKLLNEGVANVNYEATSEAKRVLRYELETFVCDGQYKKGMAHILETFLKNIDQSGQPGVWISGFYGSGKSHLAKMLRTLWVNTKFEDGATARGIANLPQNIIDLLKELDTQGKRHGGLQSVSGTLGAAASGSVRLALLRIIFKSADLPEQYHSAKFVMWLKHEGIYDSVREHVEGQGLSWEEELDNFYVAEGLHNALTTIKPNLFPSQTKCVETLNNLYPYVKDISNDEMIKAIHRTLTNGGKFPLTLVILDEVQQFIGEDSQRSMDIQEVVEACSKNFAGKLMFIGTGQTAVTGTSNLKKLEGRFTVRVELSDADVESVIRQVILAKKPESKQSIQEVMNRNMGEISRHLQGTFIGHHPSDVNFFTQDYPILPVRRRFWENVLHVLDPTGTESQLRNQLSMVHRVIQTNLDEPLGNVVPADYIYFDSADRLLQSRALPRKVHEKTMKWREGNEDEKLMARACGLVFLVNKLGGINKEIGISSTVDTIADLLVEDLSQGSSELRRRLPKILDGCDLLIKVGDEYRIQTEESAAWNDEFQSERSSLNNQVHRIETERDDRIKGKFGEIIRKIQLLHGDCKVSRNIYTLFNSKLPSDYNEKIYVWVRDGWGSDEKSVIADARQSGNQSPTIFVYLPKRSADDLRHNLIEYKAATSTLERKGVPNTPEGDEARAAMETIQNNAKRKIDELLDEAFSGARVFQSGGYEIVGNNLQDMIREAAGNSLHRLYPNFKIADNPVWSKVYEKAQKGAPDALKEIGYDGNADKNPVCKEILGYIAAGKKGTEIRNKFEEAPYGWSRDAIDGGLQVLLVAGLIRAQDEINHHVESTKLERKSIGKVSFRVESATVTAKQRLNVRMLLQKMGLSVKQSEESRMVPEFLEKIKDLADSAGGEPPKPEPPVTSFLDEIRRTGGNEQLIALSNIFDELNEKIDNWNELSERINKRWNSWLILKNLVEHMRDLPDAEIYQSQVKAMEEQRQLLEDPDPVPSLIKSVSQLLRDELQKLYKQYTDEMEKGIALLESDPNWQKLEPEQRYQLNAKNNLHEAAQPKVLLGSSGEILSTLDNMPLAVLADRVAALPSRFRNITVEAAKLIEPDAQDFSTPGAYITSEEDVNKWIAEVKEQLLIALKNGPIVIR